MRRRVVGCDAGKGGADFRIQVRSALAEQIRRPFEALAARRNLGRRSGQFVIVVAGEEGVPDPAQAQPRSLGYAHYVPQAGNRMTEGVQAAFGVFGGAGRGGKDHAGCADGGRNRPRLQDAHAHGARPLVARAGNHRRSGSQAGQAGSACADARADLGRLVYLGQPALGNPSRLGHFPGPAAMGHVEKESPRGLLHVNGELAGETVAHVVLGA